MNNHAQNSSGFHRLMADIVDLCELQWQLLSVDSQEAKKRLVKAVVLLVIAGIVCFCGLAAAAIGLGYLLVEQFELPVSAGMGLSALTFLLVAGLSALIGVHQISKANSALSETKSELAENVRWLKAVIVQPRTSARNQIRREDFPPEHATSGEPSFRRF